MRYLLDSDIVIDVLRKKRLIPEEIINEELAISAITYAELLYGARKAKQAEKTARIVLNFIKDMKIHVLPVTEQVSDMFSKDKVFLETKGMKIEDFDLLIAATAKANGLTLVTRNMKHFARISGLVLYK